MNTALQEASEIGERRSRQPPPPMSAFARTRVSNAVDGGKLQDLVEAALSSEMGSSFSGAEESAVLVDGGWPRGAGGGGGNEGWDW